MKRIVFLDWLRGLAALIILQGHTINVFLRPEEHDSAPYYLSIFVGGEAAAIFLFLTGVTYGLGLAKRDSLAPMDRVKKALQRTGYLFFLAFAFRLQTWAFSLPYSHARDLLKVDVLNLMGATALLLVPLALVQGLNRIRYAALAGVLFAVCAPLMSATVAAQFPPAIRDYLVPSGGGFSVFPWGTFLAFGAAAGSAIPRIEEAQWNRVMQWTALCGLGMLVTAQYFGSLPYSLYPHPDYWLHSPALTFGKLAVVLLLACVAYLWTTYFSSKARSWVCLLGTHSLAVYWVHVELEYGRWFGNYHERLTAAQCGFWSLVLILAMLAMCRGIELLRKNF